MNFISHYSIALQYTSKISRFLQYFNILNAINMTLDTTSQLDFKGSISDVTAINDNHWKQF